MDRHKTGNGFAGAGGGGAQGACNPDGGLSVKRVQRFEEVFDAVAPIEPQLESVGGNG